MNTGCAYPGRTSSWALDVGLRRALQVERNEWMQTEQIWIGEQRTRKLRRWPPSTFGEQQGQRGRAAILDGDRKIVVTSPPIDASTASDHQIAGARDISANRLCSRRPESPAYTASTGARWLGEEASRPV
ncbi:hypothetical protein SNOG_14376 [Parastagonospora nodorum SN15]|uniref:Uncharacterized protein n=1 Tax=Phaeosphaeria nodorum (strain SN15 / ATCC MYA-4574 / FGSC 10173) TaxID=321614 RepID=Q0U1J8_PHANO|nr:hypothetical protein SNOG_14376 [Parastagonospora nodorum SN15]EAT78247.1 hypothetical protein SNOG_14376 [Parastagonospora nodorum SN15]